MKQILLLLLSTIFLIGCTASKGRQSYEEALRYMEQGDAPQALACLKEAAEFATDDSVRMGIYNDMGRLLFDEGLQEQALGAYHMALETSQVMADSLGMAYVLFDMANIYRTRDEDDSCVYYFDTAMSLALSQKDSLLATDIRNQLAGYYLWHKDYERARQLLSSSLSQEAEMTGGICFMAADLYRQTGPADSTRYYCKLLLQNEETGLRQMGHKWLADLLLSEGQVEEAKAEFLKLLPEGVAETAFDIPVKNLYLKSTGYKLYAPQYNDIDSISFDVISPQMASMMGYAWVELTRDLQEALHVNVIIYMAKSDNDDLNHFMMSFSNIMTMCQPDPEDPTHIICTLPSTDAYLDLVPAFITTKMMLSAVPTEEGNQVMTLTDNDGKRYGKLTLVPKSNNTDGSQLKYLLDEELQASFQELLGFPLPITKISFFIAEAEPAADFK